MPGPNTPTSQNITAAANAVGSWTLPVFPTLITVTNEGAGSAWVTVDGSAPTVNGANQYLIEAGGFVEIPIVENTPLEGGTGAPPTVKAISTASLSLYVMVDQ